MRINALKIYLNMCIDSPTVPELKNTHVSNFLDKGEYAAN